MRRLGLRLVVVEQKAVKSSPEKSSRMIGSKLAERQAQSKME